jgi:TrmH family RNA methyltransferase
VRSLESKKARRDLRLVVAEGEDLFDAAYEAGLRCELVLFDAERVPADDPRVRLTSRVTQRYSVPGEMLSRVSAMGHSPRVIGVFAQPEAPGFRTVAMPPKLGLWLAGVGDPGNVGTLVRTGAAFGCDWVALGPGSADAMNPKAVRASMGGVFTTPILEGVRAEDLATRPGLRVVAGVVGGGTPHWDADLVSPLILALGAERAGIEPALEALGSSVEVVRVTIPQEATAESLNVAAAGAVLLAEARRQRAQGTAVTGS